jgi:Leucine-rich repeat (LRR) protein
MYPAIVECMNVFGECAIRHAAVILCLAVWCGCSPSIGPTPEANTKANLVEECIADKLRRLDVLVVEAERPGKGQSVQVDLTLTRVPSEALALVTRIPHVERLNLHAAELSPKDFELVGQLAELRWLELSDTSIADKDLACLAHLERLEFLLLWGTAVGDAGIEHICPLSNLQKLDLSGTQVTDAGLEKLSTLTSLLELHIENPAVSRAAVERLQQLLPHTLIVR